MVQDNYCPFIDHGLTVDSDGMARACCQIDATASLDHYHAMMHAHRQAMRRGVKIQPCDRCWRDEALGFPSLRQSAIDDFARYQHHHGIMTLDIRINNLCNLACSMCGEHASSLWGKLKAVDSDRHLDPELLEQVLANSHDLVKVSLQGGEPFYGNDFISFVDRLTNKSNMQLEIFSNCISVDIDTVRRWSNEFGQLMIIASVDGVGDTYESIRWPATWHKFERKIAALHGLPRLGLSFNYTVQNINLHDIRNFLQWRDRTAPTCPINFSILQYPKHLHYTVLSQQDKLAAIDMLESISAAQESEEQTLAVIKDTLQSAPLNQNLLTVRDQSLSKLKIMRDAYLARHRDDVIGATGEI